MNSHVRRLRNAPSEPIAKNREPISDYATIYPNLYYCKVYYYRVTLYVTT